MNIPCRLIESISREWIGQHKKHSGEQLIHYLGTVALYPIHARTHVGIPLHQCIATATK